MKFSGKQQQVIDALLMYPKDIIMFNGSMTCGHGVKLDMRAVRSLEGKGLIDKGQLTDKYFGSLNK